MMAGEFVDEFIDALVLAEQNQMLEELVLETAREELEQKGKTAT